MRSHHDADRVFLHGSCDRYRLDGLAHFQNLRSVEDAIHLRLLSPRRAVQNCVKAGQRWVVHLELHEETIELRFGQRVSPLHLQGVLRCENEKRRVQLVRYLADRDGLLSVSYTHLTLPTSDLV